MRVVQPPTGTLVLSSLPRARAVPPRSHVSSACLVCETASSCSCAAVVLSLSSSSHRVRVALSSSMSKKPLPSASARLKSVSRLTYLAKD